MSGLAVYPGTFDPVTLGHVDIVSRGAMLFPRLIVAVAVNLEKTTLFPLADRIRLLTESIGAFPNVTVERMDGMLVDYVSRVGASVILRGLRSVADYEAEAHMALMNRTLRPSLETAFLIAGPSSQFISSRLIKEIAGMGGDVSPFVPRVVVPELLARMRQEMIRRHQP